METIMKVVLGFMMNHMKMKRILRFRTIDFKIMNRNKIPFD